MKAGKVQSRTGIIFIDTIKQESAQCFATANKSFLPHTISPGCVGYTVHPILITYFILTTQRQYLPSRIFLLYWVRLCVVASVWLMFVPHPSILRSPCLSKICAANPEYSKERGEGRWIIQRVLSRNTEKSCCTFVQCPRHRTTMAPHPPTQVLWTATCS